MDISCVRAHALEMTCILARMRATVCATVLATMCAPILFVAGCQTYAPRPLTLDAHQEAFLSRTLEGGDVASFAEKLDAINDGEPSAFDLADGITLGEAECVALVFNQELRVARLRAGVTRATADNAGLWDDPVLGFDLTRLLGSAGQAWEAFGSVALTLPLSGRLEVEIAKAEVAHRAQLARIAEQEWNVRIALRRAWTQRAALATECEATREFLTRLDEIIRIVESLEAMGEISRTQANLFRVERAMQRAAQLERIAQMARADLDIRAVLGVPPRATLVLADSSLASALTPTALANLAESNLELRALSLEYEVAERTLEEAIRAQYPDLTIIPGYGTQDGDSQFVLGLSAPLAIFNGNRSEIAQARAEREVAQGSIEGALERLLNDFAQAEVLLIAATARRESIELELIPLVDEQYAQVRAIAERGEVDALLMLESLARQQDAKLLLIAALRDEVLAQIRQTQIPGPTTPSSNSSNSTNSEEPRS